MEGGLLPSGTLGRSTDPLLIEDMPELFATSDTSIKPIYFDSVWV